MQWGNLCNAKNFKWSRVCLSKRLRANHKLFSCVSASVSQRSNQVLKDSTEWLNKSFEWNFLMIPRKAGGHWGLRLQSSWFCWLRCTNTQADVLVSCSEKAAAATEPRICFLLNSVQFLCFNYLVMSFISSGELISLHFRYNFSHCLLSHLSGI